MIKKIVVLVPLLLVIYIFVRLRLHGNLYLGHRSITSMGVAILIFLGFISLDVYRRPEPDWIQMVILSSFYVYIFAVLILTGYFELIWRLSESGWAHNLALRVHRRQNINLIPFATIKIYKVTQKQIWGNLIMLLPLGIYVPLLRRGGTSFFTMFLIAILTSTTIEVLQLLTNFRSSDVDDVILNTCGAMIGYMIYRVIAQPSTSKRRQLQN